MRWLLSFSVLVHVSLLAAADKACLASQEECHSESSELDEDDERDVAAFNQIRRFVELRSHYASHLDIDAKVNTSHETNNQSKTADVAEAQLNQSAQQYAHLHAGMESQREVVLHGIAAEDKAYVNLKENLKIGGLIFVPIGLAVVILLLCCTRLSANIIGMFVEGAIAEMAPDLLGVTVDFGELRVSPLAGRIHITKMKVNNPSSKPPYTSPYVLYAQEVIVDVDMWMLISTLTSTIAVEELVLKGVHVTYESSNDFKKSNIRDIVAHLHQRTRVTENPSGKPADVEKGTSSAPEQQAPSASRSFTIRKLSVEDVSAQARMQHEICDTSASAKLTLPPVESLNFSKECEGESIEDILTAFVEKLAESILKEIEGEAFAPLRKVTKGAEALLNSAEDAAENAVAGIEGKSKKIIAKCAVCK